MQVTAQTTREIWIGMYAALCVQRPAGRVDGQIAPGVSTKGKAGSGASGTSPASVPSHHHALEIWEGTQVRVWSTYIC
jgi:hypothetical protein